MTPDLPLFVPFVPEYEQTHHVAWLPLTVVMAGALWGLWRVVIAPAARDLSPRSLARRYPTARAVPFTLGVVNSTPSLKSAPRSVLDQLVLTALALALGVLTHLVWDGFTHRGGWAVEALPALQGRVGGVPIYSLLQDGSSVLGLVIIGIWFAGLPALTLDDAARAKVRPLRLLTVGAVVGATIVSAVHAFLSGPTPWRMAFEFVTTWGVLVGVVALVAGLAWRVQVRQRTPDFVR